MDTFLFICVLGCSKEPLIYEIITCPPERGYHPKALAHGSYSRQGQTTMVLLFYTTFFIVDLENYI